MAGLPAVLLVAQVLSSCTSESSAGSEGPPETPTATTESPPPPAAAVVDVPPTLDHRSVAGLNPLHDTTNDPEDQRSVATVAVPGEPSLEEALRDAADEDVVRYEARLNPGLANELNIDWDPVLAAGPVLGVVTTTRLYTGGAHGTTSSRTFYNDLDSDSTYESADLVSDPERLTGWVADALAEADISVDAPDEEAVVRDLRFTADGAVTVVLAQGEAGAEALGEVAVRVSPATSESILAPEGRKVRRAAISAEPFEGIPDPPAPSSAPKNVPPVKGDPQPAGEAVDCDRLKCIALTFDDGPGPDTARLLNELAEKEAKATFFLIGQNAATLPELVAREVAEGHAVGNHSYDHPQLSTLDGAGIADQIDRTDAAIKTAAGITTTLVRPPYGATDDTVSSVLADRGDVQVLWNVDTEDWKNRDASITTQRALAGATPGGIILMHDIHPSTVDAVPGIIDQLRAAGYTLVTVPQLLGPSVTPGEEYFNR